MYPFDLNTPPKLRIDEIQGDEFVYFKLPKNLDPADDSVGSIIQKILDQTSRLFFSLENLNELKNYETDFSIPWFGVPVPVGSGEQGFLGSTTVYSNIDPKSLESFETSKKSFRDSKKIIPEFFLTENHFQLGPTIAEFFERYQLPFAFIKVDGPPDMKRIREFMDAFESLKIKRFKGKLYFSFNNAHLAEWNLKTYNTFSGLRTVHIDLSNKCTHSCVFCGLWGPEFIDEVKAKSPNGQLSADSIDLMNRQMPFARAIEILESLPETVNTVQFGGAGDPLTHPDWLNILCRWKSRGFSIEVLSNFEYPAHHEIDVLHKLSLKKKPFFFMVNVSAATPETYKVIRPRQSAATFEKVISNIRYARDLRNKNGGHGIFFAMTHIINVHNYKEAVKMVELAHELETDVLLKPLEVHSDIHKQYTIPKDDYPLFRETMKKALERADELKVKVVHRKLIEAIVGESA
jgi:MoaA/NifB/PqqE/SkfB family radical SAM enzyme